MYEVAMKLHNPLHNPLHHALVKDEKACPTCQFNRKLARLLTEPAE